MNAKMVGVFERMDNYDHPPAFASKFNVIFVCFVLILPSSFCRCLPACTVSFAFLPLFICELKLIALFLYIFYFIFFSLSFEPTQYSSFALLLPITFYLRPSCALVCAIFLWQPLSRKPRINFARCCLQSRIN